jgi:hypothetical protein
VATRKVEVAIVGDASSMVRAFRQADGAAGRFGKKGSKMGAIGMGLLAGGAAGAALAISQGLSAALQTGISEFSEAQKVSAQTAAALKSTGGAAGVTQQHIEDMASSMQEATGLEDDMIQSSQNLLLTFTKISNAGPDKIFDRATRATADLSVALGKDMNSSALMVGKALNDPIKGVTALGRAGVQFTAGQKGTIKSLVETGNVAGAQKMILKELETQVGGSARAFGETTPGQVEKAKRAFEDLSQGAVAAVVPLAAAVLPGLTAAIRGVTDFFVANWPKMQAAAQAVWAWFSANLLPTFRSIGTSIGSIVVSIVNFFRTNWPLIKSIVAPILAALGGLMRTTFGIIGGILKTVAALLRGDFRAAWDGLKSIGSNILQGIISIIKNVPIALWNAAKGILTAAFNLGKQVVEFIARGIGSLPGLIKRGLSSLFGLTGDAGAVNPAIEKYFKDGQKVPQAAARGIKAGQKPLDTALAGILGKSTGTAKTNAPAQAQPVGSAISDGIASGVRSSGPNVGGAIADVIRQGIAQGKQEAGIKSPSQVAARTLGGPLAQGIAKGIRENANGPKVALVQVMKNAVASAKSALVGFASSFGQLLGQARTAGDSGRLAGLESGLAADQQTRQEDSLKRSVEEAKAEEAAKQAAISGAEDAAEAQRDYDLAVRSRLDAEATLSDFYRQREIDNLRGSIDERQTQYARDIDNLAAQFARGEISAETFQTALDGLIGGETGASLGSAFALQYTLALEALKTQLTEIAKITGQGGVGAAGPAVERPTQTWTEAIETVRQRLESDYDKKTEAFKKSNKKGAWVSGKLTAWKNANAARYGVALAKGGITTGPTQALIGEAGREAVIPLEGVRARKMLRGAGMGGGTVNLTFNGVLNAQDAARVLRPEIDRLVRLAI